jgi:hypothetical protein
MAQDWVDGFHTTGAFAAHEGGGGAGGAPGGGTVEVAAVEVVLVELGDDGCEELVDEVVVVAEGVVVDVVGAACTKAAPTPTTVPPRAPAIPAVAAILLRFIVNSLSTSKKRRGRAVFQRNTW